MSKTDETTLGEDSQPSSITELEPIVKEFVEKLKSIENEQKLLAQDKKELIEEYKTKLDMKTLTSAMKAVAIREKVSKKDTFDTFIEVLERLD